MTKTTQSQSASSQPTKAYDASTSRAAKTSTSTKCKVFVIENYFPDRNTAPEQHTSISDLVNRWEKDSSRKDALKEARQWVANTFYDENDSVRTLRLNKGWSQTQLATKLGTSQPHIARIERGTENVSIETCRKLCKALDIDMNTLDQALQRQEEIAKEKISK